MRAAEIALTSEQRATLQSWLTAGKTEQRLAFRAQIILALGDGLSNKAAAERLATARGDGQQMAWAFCRARLGRGGGRAAQRQAAALRHQPRAADHRGVGCAAAEGLRAVGRRPVGPASRRRLHAPDLAGAAGTPN